MRNPSLFSDEVRAEVAACLPTNACCRRAVLSALIRTAGSYHLQRRGEVHVEIDLANGPGARRVVELLREMGAACEIRTRRAQRFDNPQRIEIVCGADPATLAVLRDAGVLSATDAPLTHLPGRLTQRACCRAGYLQGAFIAAGSVAAPRRPAHLEIRTHQSTAAEDLARIARHTGVTLTVRDRGEYAAVYTKRRDNVASLLVVVGAHDAALRLVEGEVVSQARESANRRANAETANLRRQVVTARRQLAAIRRLAASDRLGSLNASLQDAARLRAGHPELAISELAALAVPPLAKPTLARRLRRLEDLA
jgi:cell division protein WhiA